MNVVINPTGGKPGQSFKGLHAYCAHDQDQAQTSERVDWIETRNIGVSDPAQAWKVMVATAQAQNQLKQAAGVRAGRTAKNGAVMHVVLCFDKDEPRDLESMQEAADEFLSGFGVDPAKMRGKSKPKRRQFANEHQVMMYAHSDTDNHHLHLMINRVHPQTGVNLPSNQDHIKASDWALKYSKRHGTDHKTPARAENQAARKKGEYVKGTRRKSRNIYEQEKALQAASNDNDKLQTISDQQRKKDAALSLKGRNLKILQAQDWHNLIETHKSRKAAIGRFFQTQVNKAKAAVHEEFRPLRRKLSALQKSERQTFEELENSFFGKAGNIVKTARLSADLMRQDKTGIITRSFRILTNAGARKAYFEKAQARAQKALESQQSDKLETVIQDKKKEHSDRLQHSRMVFKVERKDLDNRQIVKQAQLKEDWKDRAVQRAAIYKKYIENQAKSLFKKKQGSSSDPYLIEIIERYKHREEFEKSRDNEEREQGNENHNDDEQER